MSLYDAVESHPLIRKYFRFLTTREMIPAQYRRSGIELPLSGGFAEMAKAWDQDEFVSTRAGSPCSSAASESTGSRSSICI